MQRMKTTEILLSLIYFPLSQPNVCGIVDKEGGVQEYSAYFLCLKNTHLLSSDVLQGVAS